MSSWDYWALAAVLIAGVPHGGFDGAVARRSGWAGGFGSWVLFHGGYLLLAALVTICWWQLPGPSLAIFLAISALHFGSSDIRDVAPLWQWSSAVPVIAHSGLVSIGIPSLQSQAVEPLFTILVGEQGSLWLIEAIQMIFPIWLASVMAYFGYAYFVPRWRRSAGLLIVMLTSVYWLDPLVSFSLYFCLVHSPMHSLRIWQSLEPSHQRRCAIEAAGYTIAAWLAGAALMLWYRYTHHVDIDSALLQLTFIGLAALTVPHMILVDVIDRRYA